MATTEHIEAMTAAAATVVTVRTVAGGGTSSKSEEHDLLTLKEPNQIKKLNLASYAINVWSAC